MYREPKEYKNSFRKIELYCSHFDQDRMIRFF